MLLVFSKETGQTEDLCIFYTCVYMCTYVREHMGSVQEVPSHVLWKTETFIEEDTQETLYRGQWHLSPLQSRHLGASHSFPNCRQLPHPSYIPESHQRSEISSLSKVILVWGKGRSHRAPNLGCTGAESPGWFDVLPKISAPDVMNEWACCCDEATNHQPTKYSTCNIF